MDSRPLTRWWWLSGPFQERDIERQLQWVRTMGFGGVELAWLHPGWLDEKGNDRERPAWLQARWQELIRHTKRTADELGLRCDFTLGSSWPFGGSWVEAEDAAQTFDGASTQQLGGTWEAATSGPGLVVNHLSAKALERYAEPLLRALREGLQGSESALFCDSLEIETERMWSADLWSEFESRFGYSLRPYVDELKKHRGVHYDYRKLRAEAMQREFFEAFSRICHDHGAVSRVQCHGAPVDLLTAYASVDIPESEALLFPPAFSRIAASAAAWAGRPVVSAETFTCIYGFPGWDESAEELWKQEEIGDLKLLADALFASGVNQIVWHGMPYQPEGKEVEFYASVHVGPDSRFADELPAFNGYLESVSRWMRQGRTYAGVGLYLPQEDAWMADRIPRAERTPGANYVWEMRGAVAPEELAGHQALWISKAFLLEARVERGKVRSREIEVDALYVDCRWMDAEVLREFARLADEGAKLVWKRSTREPGKRRAADYAGMRRSVRDHAFDSLEVAGLRPLLQGQQLPAFWARQLEGDLILFFAHPHASEIRYPMPFRFSAGSHVEQRRVYVHWAGQEILLDLQFAANQSLLLRVGSRGEVEDLTPVFKLRDVARETRE